MSLAIDTLRELAAKRRDDAVRSREVEQHYRDRIGDPATATRIAARAGREEAEAVTLERAVDVLERYDGPASLTARASALHAAHVETLARLRAAVPLGELYTARALEAADELEAIALEQARAVDAMADAMDEEGREIEERAA